MAEVVTQRTAPAEFIEAAGKTYLTDLQKAIGGYKQADLSTTMGQQFVAGQDPLSLQAQQLATQGIGGYQPYLQAAQAATGPTGYQAYMSPYQQDVINTTLQDYDIQAQKGLGSFADRAVASGAFGGARQGVAEAEYMSGSDRNRAALQAQLLNQGFGQAQGLAQQNYLNQLNLGGQQQQFLGQDIGALSTFGAQNQALQQAQLSANQQLAQQQLMQPLTAAQQYGAGVTGLIAGYPGKSVQETTPSQSPMASALGVGSTLAGIYSLVRPRAT